MCVLSEKTGPKQELFWLESARRVCGGVKLTSTTDCRPVSDARKLRSVGTFTIQPRFSRHVMCSISCPNLGMYINYMSISEGPERGCHVSDALIR
jgi:hypothetical protein